MVKLKKEPRRCGECKLEERTLLQDKEGNWLKDSIGNYVYETFTSESMHEMKMHLESEHEINLGENYSFGQCFDCMYYYRRENLPIGADSAGGLIEWCYDCSQKRCLGYGTLRRYMFMLLRTLGRNPKGTEDDYELFELLKEQIDL